MDSTEFDEIAVNFDRVLNALLQKDYNVTSDVYFDMFIKHLSNRSSSDADYSRLLRQPSVLVWMQKSVEKIVREKNNVAAFTFTCRMLALLTENVEHFIQLNRQNIYSKLKDCIYTEPALQTPSTKLSIIVLYQSMLKHPMGIEWLKQESAWRMALDYCFEDQTIYVVRSANSFITDYLFLVADSSNVDEALCSEIIGVITRPLEENAYAEDLGKICVDDSDMERKVSPSITILQCIFERYIDVGRTLCILQPITHKWRVKRNLWKFLDMTHDVRLFEKIMQCKVYLIFAMLIDTLNAHDATHDFNEFGLNFLNTIKICVLKNQFNALLAVGKHYYVLWRKMGDRVPEEIMFGNQLTKFENQVIICLLLPVIQIMRRYPSRMVELYEDYILKLFEVSAEHTLRICYSFRDSMVERKSDLTDISCRAIQSILSMEQYLHRDRAVLVFRALCHFLKGAAFDTDPETFAEMVERPALLTAVINGLYSTVQKYRITWKESYETIALLNCAMAMMEHANLPPRLAVDLLKLSQLSVEHFLATNMALLVDTMSGSDMEKLGPMILKRLHDPNWEVRDSAVELLASTAKISMLKFPAFQQHIISNGLCPIVVQVAQHDTESYVRASAMACLGQMVPLNSYWEQCTSSMNLTTYLIELLYTEYEGIVRKEAVQLLSIIHENKKFGASDLQRIYRTMAHVAVSDLFWEVKVKALEFWHSVIKEQLAYQGVIDGNFPSVTFSKEKKKIVTLTEKEITSRLTRMLDELSTSGCLRVLLTCMRDEDDLMVVKASVRVIKFLIEFLDKYSYWQQLQESSPNRRESVTTDANMDANTKQVESAFLPAVDAIVNVDVDVARSEAVIQSIVSAQDINLLSIAYGSQMNMEVEMDGEGQNGDVEPIANVTAYQFLSKVKAIELDALVSSRTEWIEHTDSFPSLLSDMLYSLQVIPANEADCY